MVSGTNTGPIISQIIGEINSKTIGKMKIKMGMPSELKALIRNRKLLTLKHGVLYKRSKVDARTKHLLVIHPHTDKGHWKDVMTRLGTWVKTGF